MKKIVKKFASFAEAERSDKEYYLSLSPEERLDILLELIAQYREGLDEDSQRFKRVYKITKLE